MKYILELFHSETRKTLGEINSQIWLLPYDCWTDPIEGPNLRYQMTMHDDVQFEHYGSEHYVSEEP